MCVLSCFSHVRLCNPMDYSLPAPLSMGFSRLEYWSGLPCPPPGDLPWIGKIPGSGLPCPPPGDLPNPGIKLVTLKSSALAGRFFTTSATWEAPQKYALHLQIRVTAVKVWGEKVSIVMNVSTGHTEPTTFFFHFI